MLDYKCFASTLILLGLVVATLSSVKCPSVIDQPGDFCPPWMTSHPNGSCICEETEPNTTILKCSQKDRSLTLFACYCVSYYSELNQTVVGNCLYSCTRSYYYTICPHQLDKVCQKYNRRGELCGKCFKGMGYPVYSYSSTCINCTSIAGGILKFAAISFIPLTIFYVVVIVFRISATSEKLVGYVMVSQIITMPAQLRYISTITTTQLGKRAIKIAISIHEIWNLDFFKSIHSPFCFNPKLSSVGIASLNYIIALYPLCLILLTYILVCLHDRYPAMASAWKPIQKVFSHIRHRWNIRKSLVDVFATFLLLSYMKILDTSFDILIPTVLYNMQGRPISRKYLYYDGSLRFFQGHHSWYTLLAVTMLLLFNAMPLLLLLLYPCYCFQSLLNWCGRSRFQLMHTFMDSYQGCYKLSPIDCRHFAAINMVARLANLVIFSLTLTRFYFIFACTTFTALAALVVILKPYRDSKQNTLDAILYLITAFGYSSAASYALSPERFYSVILIIFIEVTIALLFLYILFVVFHKSTLVPLCAKLKAFIRTRKQNLQEIDEALFNSIIERNEKAPLLETDSLAKAKEMTRSTDKTEY